MKFIPLQIIGLFFGALTNSISLYLSIVLLVKTNNEEFYNLYSSNIFFKLLFLEILFGIAIIVNILLIFVALLKGIYNSIYWIAFFLNGIILVFMDSMFYSENDYENLNTDYVVKFFRFYLFSTLIYLLPLIEELVRDNKKEN